MIIFANVPENRQHKYVYTDIYIVRQSIFNVQIEKQFKGNGMNFKQIETRGDSENSLLQEQPL